MGTCRICGCTDDDCSQCIAATGEPCSWVEVDLCSRCADLVDAEHFPVESRDSFSHCWQCRRAFELSMSQWVQMLDADDCNWTQPMRPACPCVLHGRGAVRC